MSRTTRFLKLFLPSDNEYYNVEKDQNENFEKIDKKLGEFDKGKEPTIKDKKTGFNLEKSDRYDYDSSSTLATSRALKLLYDFLLRKIQGIKLTWSAIEEKPSTFPPSTHNHDDRYYTETETDTKLNNLAGKKDGTFPLRHAEKGNVYYLPSTNKYYFCKEDYDGYQISVPNSNFIEMSVYENLNRLNNLDKKWKKIIDEPQSHLIHNKSFNLSGYSELLIIETENGNPNFSRHRIYDIEIIKNIGKKVLTPMEEYDGSAFEIKNDNISFESYVGTSNNNKIWVYAR